MSQPLFKSFSADSFDKCAVEAEIFAAEVHVTGISAVRLGALYYIVLQYFSDQPYAVSISRVRLELPTVAGFDSQYDDVVVHLGSEVAGHSMFIDDGLYLVLMVKD
jgi:hypothetical protein